MLLKCNHFLIRFDCTLQQKHIETALNRLVTSIFINFDVFINSDVIYYFQYIAMYILIMCLNTLLYICMFYIYIYFSLFVTVLY